jgi:hypothetical protein
MSDDEPERSNFEEVARALADEVTRALERISEIDVDEIARTASTEAERARQWMDDLGRWLREQAGGIASADFVSAAWPDAAARAADPAPSAPAEDPLKHAGPHPLDLPSAEQGLALAALDSGRWRIEPGTTTLGVHGEGPGPRDALGLVRELRVRDWLSSDGEITLAGRHALKRWLEAAGPA